MDKKQLLEKLLNCNFHRVQEDCSNCIHYSFYNDYEYYCNKHNFNIYEVIGNNGIENYFICNDYNSICNKTDAELFNCKKCKHHYVEYNTNCIFGHDYYVDICKKSKHKFPLNVVDALVFCPLSIKEKIIKFGCENCSLFILNKKSCKHDGEEDKVKYINFCPKKYLKDLKNNGQ